MVVPLVRLLYLTLRGPVYRWWGLSMKLVGIDWPQGADKDYYTACRLSHNNLVPYKTIIAILRASRIRALIERSPNL